VEAAVSNMVPSGAEAFCDQSGIPYVVHPVEVNGSPRPRVELPLNANVKHC
jgi:hypothetical protein